MGALVKMAAEKGRSIRPNIKLGICGEHGGDPSSIEFCHKMGLNYVSCSPFRVPIARLAAAQAEALVFLGKVGFSVSQEHLNEGSFGQYDGEFLVLDEADRFAGDVIDLPASLCACVRFRGHHAESPAQYRRLMQFIREEGYTAAGFSREITVIDYGFTPDTEKFVTEIMIPLQKV